HNANLSPAAAVAACFGVAGAGRPAEQERIARWAEDRAIARRVCVVGDAEPILAAATPDNCGVALICGTGSLAWGRNALGQTARSGGWGYLIGDEGSGYAIARAAVAAAMRAADGRGQPTAILELLLKKFGVASPPELVERIYAPEFKREQLATLCTLVFDAA